MRSTGLAPSSSVPLTVRPPECLGWPPVKAHPRTQIALLALLASALAAREDQLARITGW